MFFYIEIYVWIVYNIYIILPSHLQADNQDTLPTTHTHTRAHTQTLNMLECQEKCDNVVAAVSVFDLNRVIKGPD